MRVSDTGIQKLVMRMKRLEIKCRLTEDQKVVLFNSIRQSPQLKHLILDWSLLVDDPATVANSLSKLESVNMSQCNVPPMIVTMLATNLQSGSSALKKIRLGGVDVSEDCK